ncbi:outer membrane lipoprotein carrier protein LolA [Solimonas variicoloris]|uniref:outer membrane lipoprotein carrier protein LolA n=1 Tax=Solimonas variicoloris TaxID=254408 RepID=UPI0003663370|nr:outer membrane lipoprotein carrier protein LolA [Solimonas variicoloris]
MKRLLLALTLACAPAVAAASAASASASVSAETVFAHPADAATIRAALVPVTARLAAAQSISGPYQQKKYLRELPRPLLASGDFTFVRDHGITWRTTTPFASELVIQRDALVQRDANGQEVRIDAAQQPAVRMVARIFFAVFSLDFAELEQLFALSLQQDGGGWQLGLQPKQASGTIDAIIVSGRNDVERVRLLERGGDRTEIEFQDTRVSSSAAPAARAR